MADPTPNATTAAMTPVEPQKPGKKAPISLPNHKDPETTRYIKACKVRTVSKSSNDEPEPVHQFCGLPGCGYPMIPLSDRTGNPADKGTLTCGWDGAHDQLLKDVTK